MRAGGSDFVDRQEMMVEDGSQRSRRTDTPLFASFAMTQIDELLTRLASADLAGAEGALARLAIEGARAIEPLLAAFSGAPDAARARMLRLLERVPDARTMPLLKSTVAGGSVDLRRLAVRALGTQPAHRTSAALMEALPGEGDPDVRAEMVAILARLAGSSTPEILDPVLDLLFNPAEPLPVRRAALTALAGLKPGMACQLLERLAASPAADPFAAEIDRLLQAFPEDPLQGLPILAAAPWREEAPSRPSPAAPGLLDIPRVLSTLETDGQDPETAYRCARALQALPHEARLDLAGRLDPSWPLPVLDGVMDTLRRDRDLATLAALAKLARGLAERIGREPDPDLSQQLSARRARAHRLIARGGSRLAIADLKDALRAAELPPHDLVLALAEIGRAEDLADLLGVHDRADPWLRGEVEAAARVIMGRERPRRLRRVIAALPAAQAAILRSLEPRAASRPPSPSKDQQRGEEQ